MQNLVFLLQAPKLSSAEDFWAGWEGRGHVLPQVTILGQDAQQCFVQNWAPQPMFGQQQLPNYILVQILKTAN